MQCCFDLVIACYVLCHGDLHLADLSCQIFRNANRPTRGQDVWTSFTIATDHSDTCNTSYPRDSARSKPTPAATLRMTALSRNLPLCWVWHEVTKWLVDPSG